MRTSFGFLLWLDLTINFMIGGDPTETLSSRAWRMEQKRQPYWGWTRRMIDGLFFWQQDHCYISFKNWTALKKEVT